MRNLFELINVASEETIHLVLEGIYILAKLNPEFVPELAKELSPKMIEMYQILHRDPLNGGVIKDIIKLFCTQQESYIAVTETFLPYILDVFKFKVETKGNLTAHLNLGGSTEEDYLAALFDIVRQFIKCEIDNKEIDKLL